MEFIKTLTPVNKAVKHRDLRAMLEYCASEYGNELAFRIKHKEDKGISYEDISFEDLLEQVRELGSGMLSRGWLGKRCAIIANNSYEWMLSYLSITGGIGMCIPLDKGLPVEELIFSLQKSCADILFYDKAHESIVEELKKDPANPVKEYVLTNGKLNTEEDGTEHSVSIRDLRTGGIEARTKGDRSYDVLPIDPMETAIILFTSGTTSMAKAVQLSHENIVSNIYSMQLVEDIRRGDMNMAFLPYHHTFGCTGQLMMLACGAATAYCDGLKYLQKNLVEYKVSVFVCVPLLIESVYKRVMNTIEKKGLSGKVEKGRKIADSLLKLHIDVRRKVFKEVLDQLGGNLRAVISGASALDPVCVEGFKSFGIDVVQGYGMTESSPCLAAETARQHRSGSIGYAMPGVTLMLDEPNAEGIGELIAKGPNIMKGYYENEEETARVIVDGWLHTGDLAYLDKDGYIFLCGRKKNVIVMKSGKNVYPEELETLISALPYVEENMVFGLPRRNDDEKDLILNAKIVYKKDYMSDTYGLSDPEEIEKKIKEDIYKINDTLPNYKQMYRIIVTDEPMIKTTTGKVKRFEEIRLIREQQRK